MTDWGPDHCNQCKYSENLCGRCYRAMLKEHKAAARLTKPEYLDSGRKIEPVFLDYEDGSND